VVTRRVALLADGASIHVIRWANALALRGHEVHVISHRHDARQLDASVGRHVLGWKPPLGYFVNAGALRRVLADLRPDLLNTHFASGYGTLGRTSGFHPNVLSVWGSDVYEFPERSPLHRALLRANLRRADWVCSTSHDMADRIRGVAPVERLSVVAFGIDVDRFAPQPSSEPDRSDGDVVVGTVKTLRTTYGIDLLVRAFASTRERVAAERPDLAERLRLVVVGGGPEEANLRRLAEALGVADRTTFVGPVPHGEVPTYLRSLDVYVALSRRESFGVAVLEASAVGVPVVVADVGGLPEVVLDGTTGFVVAAEDPLAAAEAIRRLVLDRAARERMGAAGRRHVAERYDWSQSVVALEEVYGRAIEAFRQRGGTGPISG
jgi:glycosyltransferase involved in cell wall biosynthesis